MKKTTAWTATLLLCALVTLVGVKAFYTGWRFATERRPDGRFAVHLDQIIDLRHPSTVLGLRDRDAANGYIRLVTPDGRTINEVYSTNLTFVIVIWHLDHVEIQADRVYRWSLP